MAVDEQAALELAQGLARRAPRQAQARLALIERGQVVPAAALEKEIPGAREALRALQKKGAVVLRQQEVGRGAYQDLKMEAAQTQPQLSAGQAGCADAIMCGVEGHSGVYLLHGCLLSTSYVMDDPIISDAQWDKLFDELRDLEKETGTVLPDSPSLRVGGTILEAFTPHTHLGPLWSMDKAKTREEVEVWAARAEKLWAAYNEDAVEKLPPIRLSLIHI